MRAIYAFLALVVWALAGPAWAGGWYTMPSATGSTVAIITPTEQQLVYYVFTSADSTHQSTVLDTSRCGGGVTLGFHRDTSATGGTAEIKVYESTAGAGSTSAAVNTLRQISADADGDGVQDDLSIDGETANRRGLRQFWADGLVVDVVTAAGASDTPVVPVFCHGS